MTLYDFRRCYDDELIETAIVLTLTADAIY